MGDYPTISVVIPTHNRIGLLYQAIRSVFDQDDMPEELIVVDDGSSPAVGKSLFDSAPDGLKTKLIRNHVPVGSSAARNLGVEHATGAWIAFLDDDDAFLHNKIHLIREVLRSNPDADLVYHPAEIRMVRENISYLSGAERLDVRPESTRKLLVRNLVGGTSMTILKKQVLQDNGGFDTDMPPIEDHELWLRLSLGGYRFCFVDNPLTRYYHDTAATSLTHSFEKEEMAHAQMLRKYAKEYATLSKGEISAMELHRLRGKVFKSLLNNNLRMAIKWQARVLRYGRRMKDLAGLLVIPFGLKAVFRLRSLFGRRNPKIETGSAGNETVE